ncbi:MAG: metallopeptidase family protein [Oscillospiraceae bacterium]|jgi:hypothetical protein|nr:metallopeptidase family protein [Oscillospiraceae bacterium]
MVTFDEAADMLDEIAEEMPEAFYSDLNGGVYLLPDTKRDPESDRSRPLYILGQYISRPDLGKYINMYYGSFMKIYSHLPPDAFKRELKRVLVHEFTHHVEFLAGECGLEIKDEIKMEKYRRDRRGG